MASFECLSVSPAGFQHAAIALATARAGGIGILDFECCTDLEQHEESLRRLGAAAGNGHRIGLRIAAAQWGKLAALMRAGNRRGMWAVVAAYQITDVPDVERAIARLAEGHAGTILVEVVDAITAERVSRLPIAGIMAKGYEAGGWVGADTAFILAQRILALGRTPVYVRGGIGLHSAAACRAGGAAGVVLDDQLLLMPESPLSAPSQRHLEGLVGNETTVSGERLGAGCRVLVRPGFRAAQALEQLVDKLEAEGADSNRWRTAAADLVGWQSPDRTAWPIGQAVGLATAARDRFKTTGRLVQALLQASAASVQTAIRLKPLAPDAPLARSHRTRFPILQGPMTRVSDRAEFAAAVAGAGALPLLALALMRPEQATDLLTAAKKQLGDRPWGVGILGFVPQAVREAQFEVIARIKPPFALIAGGRPDQADRFEAAGIAAYIHVPSPHLLRLFLEQGARRFVFEGRECGGHVGPLASFMLWEHAVAVLLDAIRGGLQGDIHAVFAGGIHDARSAAMVSTLAAPLAEHGVKIGVLMGSAYLFTHEIVASGAVVPAFQQQALACRETVTLETGQGHASRCAVTDFAREFYDAKRRLRSAGRSADEARDTLENLSLGRLRAAAKGEMRDQAGALHALDVVTQVREGMYMIGQVATLRDTPLTLAELHREVAEDSAAMLDALLEPTAATRQVPQPADVAIVGIGTLLPRAQHPQQFWQNILANIGAITEIPLQRWDWRLYFDGDRRARDKVYSKWGGFLAEIEFDPLRYGIPPNSLRSIDPMQLLGLEVVRRALEDAGYGQGGLDHEHTSVILGASGGLGDLGLQYGVRAELPRFVASIPDEVWERLPEWTEESFAGTLLNVVAGRIANRFNFGGLNFTVDAACASSLAAVHLALAELESGRSNVVIAGGVDTVQSPFGFLCFAKTQALTPSGRARTFDRTSDGIVISEGLAVVVLKRLADAERDGDRIYAVIKGTGGSSDGKALGLTAPLPDGQMAALRRAYGRAGFGPETLGLLEAHGTGTAVGDRAETETVVRTLRAHGTPARNCAIGSVKTLIGHTKATAGIAGLIKVALALQHKALPPHASVATPIEPIADGASPVYLCRDARPWVAHPDHPRRGAVSAFGFGGTNFHAVLEEYRDDLRPAAAPAGGMDWPSELIVLRADSEAALLEQVKGLHGALEAGAAPQLRDLAYSLALRADERTHAPYALALVADHGEHLKQTLATLVAQPRLVGIALPPGVVCGERQNGSKLAFLFPGQGAQYPEMGRETMLFLPELRQALEFADGRLRTHFPQRLSQYIFPPTAFSEAEETEAIRRITDTHVAQPAIGVVAVGWLDFLARLGVTPDLVAGHSYGEYVALHAAGAMNRAAFLDISEMRGRVMAEASTADNAGAMAAIQCDRDTVAALVASYPGVTIANHNSSSQCVVSGSAASVRRLVDALTRDGLTARLLSVSAAFHSPLMAGAQSAMATALARLELAAPRIPVYSNATARPYPNAPGEMRALLADHMLSSVEFVQQIHAMHDDGARLFLELGPKAMLSRLVDQILEARPHTAVSMGGAGDFRGALLALGTLAVHGASLALRALFDQRPVRPLNLERLAETTRKPAPAATVWYLTGGGVRRPDEPAIRTGKRVALTMETQRAEESSARAQREQRADSPASVRVPSIAPPAVVSPGPSQAPAQLSAAWNAYQETMRQFLSVQEGVMRQFLGGEAPATTVSAHLPQATTPELVAPAPVLASSQTPNSPSTVEPSKPPPTDETALPGRNRAELKELLLQLVSERTGYPAGMLGLQQDMEAELGIDSIKRVEILGALQKQLPGPLAATVRAAMEQLTRVKTLEGVLERLTASPAADAAPSVAPPKEASRPTRAELGKVLLGLVSERTGYPEELLGLAQDMEAELGIDSIKRVEILGALQKALPAELAEAVRGAMEQLTRVKTLGGLLDRLSAPASPHVATPSPQRVPAPAPPPAAAIEEMPGAQTPRFLLAAQSQPLPAVSLAQFAGLYLVLGGPAPLAQAVAEQLRQRGADPRTIARAELAQPERLRAVIDQFRAEASAAAGIVHLAGFGERTEPDGLSGWRELAQIQIKSLFETLKQCAADLVPNGRVLAATSFGGRLNRDGRGTDAPATGAGTFGLLKTLAAEWPEALIKAVDFDPALGPDAVAAAIVQELLVDDREVEIGYAAGGRAVFRSVLAPLPLPRPQLMHRLDDRAVVLATAGARGITAEVVTRLARSTFTVIVVGRVPEPGPDGEALAAYRSGPELRQALLNEARSRGALPTPVEIEQRVQDIVRAREIRNNLARLKQSGAQVEYIAADVRNEEQFGGIIDALYSRYGRIDAVIHGAGIIEDKLLRDKSTESFARVLDTKVDSAFILARHLRPDSLRLLVFFTSVAGVFGNRGQSDYAAANEVVNRLAIQLDRRWPDTRVAAINWGPWDTPGMASEEVKRQFRDRGIGLISDIEGCRFFTDEIRYGRKGDVEVIAGDGPWSASSTAVRPRVPRAPGQLLVRQQPQAHESGAVLLEHQLGLATDPYLGDHCLDDKPVLPAAGALELLAEFVQRAWPDFAVSEVRSLSVLRGLVIERSAERKVLLCAKASSHADADGLQVTAEILEPKSRVPFYRAFVLLRPQLPEPAASTLAPIVAGAPMDAAQAYRQYLFHGARFQLIDSIERLNGEGAAARVRSSELKVWLGGADVPGADWLFDPGLVDTAPQLAIVWSRVHHNTTPLPSRLGSVRRFAGGLNGGALRLLLRVRGNSEHGLVYDADFIDEHGRVRVELRDIESSSSMALNRLAANR